MAILRKKIRMKKKVGNDIIISYPQTVDDNILVYNETKTLRNQLDDIDDNIGKLEEELDKLSKYVFETFDFDNIVLPNTVKTYDDSVANKITEYIRYKADNKLIASLITDIRADSYDETITLYKNDGSIFSQDKATTTFPSGKPRKEVVRLVGVPITSYL